MTNTFYENLHMQIEGNIESFDPEVKAVIERTVHELVVAEGPDSFFEAEGISEQEVVQRCLGYGDSKWKFTTKSLLETFIKEVINEKLDWQPYASFKLNDFKIEEEWLGAVGGIVRMSFNDIEVGYRYDKYVGRRFDNSFEICGVIGSTYRNEPKTFVDKEQFITFCKASIFMFLEACCGHRYDVHEGRYMNFTADEMNHFGDAHIIEDNLRSLMCQLLRMYVAFEWSRTFREEEKKEEVAA